jgi:hypothetical protein
MTLAVPWLVVPALLAAASLGLGLLAEHVVGFRLPWPLLMPSGFALCVVALSLLTMSPATAPFASPTVSALAAAGLLLALPSRRRPDGWAAASALGVYACFAAPIVLSGSATFAGYISLDDTATWLAFADRALLHGRSLAGLAPSTYQVVLNDNFPSGYPLGAMLPLGFVHQLSGVDSAWLFQPLLAFLAAMLALCLYELMGLVRRRPLRAFCAVVAAQPALLYGYAFWSGLKELTVAVLLALSAALAALVLRSPVAHRARLPLAVSGAAIVCVLGALGSVWLAGLALAALVVAGTRRVRPAPRPLALASATGVVLALPALAEAHRFLSSAEGSDSGHGGLGNLVHPLSLLQIAGIWPTGDFRLRPSPFWPVALMVTLLACAAVAGIAFAVARRSFGLPLYVGSALGGVALVLAADRLAHGSPWLDAKALATGSPALLAAAVTAGALLVETRSRWLLGAGATILAVLAGGVLWSNFDAYGAIWLAPSGQLVELQTIGRHFAGQGPALMTEYQPYGVRHFLRSLDPEGASERRARPVTLRSGGVLQKAQYADLDAFDLGSILTYRTLVLRTSPYESRPPSVYRLVWAGRFYQVWQRPPTPTERILEHLSLEGDDGSPDAVPRCTDVMRLASLAAGAGGSLVASVRPQPLVVDLTLAPIPPGWQAQPDGTLVPRGSGTVSETVSFPHSGPVYFSLGGSFRGQALLSVDGEEIGEAQGQLEETAQLTPIGKITLSPGPHRIAVSYQAGGWRPGSRAAPFALGPLVAGQPASAALVAVAPMRAGTLCGRPLDWVEAVSPR